MPLILSGTNGVSGVDGSAGTPSYQGTDTNTGIFYPAADTIAFAEGGAEIARFDSSGNLGIGTSSPSNRLSVVGGNVSVNQTNATITVVGGDNTNLQQIRVRMSGTDGILDVTRNSGTSPNLLFGTEGTERMRIDSSGNVAIGTTTPVNVANYRTLTINASTGGIVYLQNNGTNVVQMAGDNSTGNIYTLTNIPFIIGTNNTERMRIMSSGEVVIGATTSFLGGRLSVSGQSAFKTGTNQNLVIQSGASVPSAVVVAAVNDIFTANIPIEFRGSAYYFPVGLNGSAGTNAVRFNTSTFLLSYDTSSARYKNNIRDSKYGLADVLKMRSAQFEYKEDGRTDVGLIAEELQPIIPELVGIDKNGLADSVSYDRMVSVLVKAIQEQQAMIEELKQEVAALKGV